jgi:TP901 family phage tail tape measure protein
MSAGSVWMDIIPRIVGYAATVQAEVVTPSATAGAESGKVFSEAFTRAAVSGTSSTTAAMQSQVRAAQATVEQSSVAISAARDRELAAADRVRIAETKLAEARARYASDSSAVIAAEARVEQAKRTQVTASEKVTVAEANEGRAKSELIARNDALAASEVKAGEAAAAAGAKTDAASLASTASFAKLALGTAAAATALGVDAVYQAGNFQQALTKLATTAGETQGNLGSVGQGMLDMAGQVGTSAQDLAKAMYVVDSSGIHGADSLIVLKAAAQGAAQEQADLGHVTDAVTTALHDYHLPASDAAKVTSELVTAVSHGKTTFDELTGAMHSVTPIASAAGISLAEAAGALASMTASGMSADQAAQNLGSTIKGLSAPTQPVIKELAALGLNSVELSKNLGSTGVAGTLQEVSTAILQHMGPAGTTLLDTMNQSKLAGADASKMYAAMAPEVRKVADELVNGTITTRQFTTGTGHLNASMQAQARQWLTNYKNANSFSQILKSGGNDTQTYMEALKRATGTADGMAVALQTTGENAVATNAAIADIAGATAQADGSIKGWDEVQGNFNQKLREVIDGIKSWVIELGQKLLPSVTTFLDTLMTTAHWLGDHATLLKDVGAGILVVVGAFAVYESTVKTVMGVTKAWGAATAAWTAVTNIAKIATLGWTGATEGLNVAMKANMIGLVVVAITALVAGVIYAYTHFDWFKNVIDSTWTAIKSFIGEIQSGWNALKYTFSGASADMVADGGIIGAMAKIGVAARNTVNRIVAAVHWVRDAWSSTESGAKSLWQSIQSIFANIKNAFIDVGHWAVSMWNDIKKAWDAVAGAATWLWSTVLKPTFDAITGAFQAVGTFFMAVWNDFLHPVIELFGAVVMFAWTDFIRPALGMIASAWQAFADTVRQTYDTVIDAVFKAFGAVVDWVWTTILKPTFDAIGTAVDWLANSVLKPTFDAISTAWHATADAMRSVYDTVINAVFTAVGNAITWLSDSVVKPSLNAITTAWDAVGAFFDATWNKVIKPVLDFVGNAIENDLVSKFNTGVSMIKTAWDTLQEVVKAPIRFVVETVLNNGLIAGFNDLAGFFGTDKIPTITLPQGFATGGPVWGAGTSTSDSIPALLSNEEHVWTADEVQGAGGHGAVQELRAMARAGMFGFASGGPVVQGYSLGGIIGSVGSAVGSAASAAGNVLGDITGALSDPMGTLRKLVEGLFSGLGAVEHSGFGQMVLGAPRKLLEAAVAKVTGMLGFGGGASVGGGTGAIPTGAHLDLINAALQADGVPAADWARWEAGMDTLIGRESGWNPGAQNNWDSNAAAGMPSGGLTQTIQPTFMSNRNPALSANMFDPVANIAASINYIRSRYGDISAVQQANPSLPAKGYDSGGWLMPGVQQVVNASQRPEPVFSAAQWEVLRQNIRGIDGAGGTTITGMNVAGNVIVSDLDELNRHERDAAQRASQQYRLPR